MSNMKTIEVSYDIPGVCWITLNRPEKYNAWNFEMYNEILPTLKSADADSNCKIIVLTGNGKFFSSGNDQNNIFQAEPLTGQDHFKTLIDLLIDIVKPMIALVNGPAVGMGVTMLGHFDLVIASDTATFSTPFTRLGLCPEACSSYLFPQIMGYSNAAEILLFNKKANAEEMKACGLVSRVIPHGVFVERTKAIVREYAQLSGESLAEGKKLIRPKALRDKLHEVNATEAALINQLFMKPAAIEAMIQFTKRKSKL